jgi:4-amino-4-deoxy-L-arabinose transferase-like glycosyltransferase
MIDLHEPGPAFVVGHLRLPRRTTAIVLVALLVVGLVVQLGMEASRESTTYDEPVYVDAGQQLFNGRLLNTEHPPLAKAVFGLAEKVFAPSRPRADSAGGQLWLLGSALSAARWVNIVLAVLIAILVIAWSAQTGKVAALSALAVAVFDPTLLAHAHLATLDVPNAATVGLSCYCAERLDARPSVARLCWLSLALGAAFLTKWSAFALIPALPLAAFLGSLIRERKLRPATDKAAMQVFAVLMGLALMVLVYAAFWNVADLKTGLLFQYRHEQSGHVGFLFGTVSANPPWWYFPFTLAVKEPLALLPLVLVGAYAARRRTFLWVPALIIVGVTSAGSVKTGIRYLLPAYVMLYVLAGIGVGHLWSTRRQWVRVASVVLIVSYAVSSLAVFPDHLAYFNETAILSSWQGQDWLNDSNADWGQGLKTLRHDLQALKAGDVCLQYQGSGLPGLIAYYLGPIRIDAPGTCRYRAVSSWFLVTDPANAGLLHQRPLNKGPIYIFDRQAPGTSP